MQVMQQSESESLRHVRRRHSCVFRFGASQAAEAQKKASLLGGFYAAILLGIRASWRRQGCLSWRQLQVTATGLASKMALKPEVQCTSGVIGPQAGLRTTPCLDKITCTAAML